MPPLPTTSYILYRKVLEKSCGAECVQWAAGLLEAGRESASIRMLAGMLPPYSHFEMAALRDRILDECGVLGRSRRDASCMFASELLANCLAGSVSFRETLAILYDACRADNFGEMFFTFYRLHHAQADVDADAESFDWPGATKENFETLFREQAEVWLRTYGVAFDPDFS